MLLRPARWLAGRTVIFVRVLGEYVSAIAHRVYDLDILFLASGLAFNGVLTLIPLMMLLASVLGFLLNSSTEGVKGLSDLLNAIFPPEPCATNIKQSILTLLHDIVDYRKSLGLFGILVLGWTATSLFDALRTALHRVYYIKKTKGLFAGFLHELGFLLLSFVLFTATNLAVWVFSAIKESTFNYPILKSFAFPGLDYAIPTVAITWVTAVMFFVIYRYMTDTKPPRRAALISTVTTTVLWVLSGKIFGVYLARFSAIGTLYGPYAFILVVLFWIYYSSLIFIFGGIVGQVYWERRRKRQEAVAG